MRVEVPGRGQGRLDIPAPARPPGRARGKGLAPPRDTGIVVGKKTVGQRRGRGRPSRTRDHWMLPMLGGIALVLGAGLVAYWSTLEPPPPPQLASAQVPEPVTVSAPKIPAVASPCFAAYGNLRIHLPVPSDNVTTIAFHQASFSHAVPMASLVPDMSLGNAKTIAAELRAVASGAATSAPTAAAAKANVEAAGLARDVWRGSAIRLYRSGRNGKPDTAVDVGAAPGTPVLAPVDGTVVLVRTYKLYSKYDDYEVHISPTDQADVDAIVIHVTDVCVQPGQRVQGGVTRIASVRKLSHLTALQLKDYAADGGDHAHLQLNRLPQAGMLWISTPAGPRIVPFQTGNDTTAAPAAPASP